MTKDMTKPNNNLFKDITVLIVGLGGYTQGSGVSAAQFFARNGADVIISDVKTKTQLRENVKQLKEFTNIKFDLGKKHDITLIDSADVVFQNPGVPDLNDMIVRAQVKGVSIVNDWTLFFLHPKANCIAVTGTRGKSTTTSLLHAMVKGKHTHAKLAGNIGVSPLQFLETYKGELVVAELSSWLLRGLRSIKKSPKLAIVTNIMNDHQNMYPSMKAYINDKKEIFKYQTNKNTTVLNYDDPKTRAMGKSTKGKVVWVSLKKIPDGSNGIYVDNGMIVYRNKGKTKKIVREGEYPLFGEHNTQNIMFATAAALSINIPLKTIQKVIKKFKGITYRLEHIRRWKGMDFYNDATATTPDAMIAAISAFIEKRDVVLIAGGMDKELDYTKWAKVAAAHTKSIIMIPGSATDKMRKAIKPYGYRPIYAKDLKDAMKCAMSIAQKGDNIVFSPGGASFNGFKNEFDRGDQFNKIVLNLR